MKYSLNSVIYGFLWLCGSTLGAVGSGARALALEQEGTVAKNPVRLELSPMVGSGNLSSGDRVRHATGYGLSISRALHLPLLTDGWLVVSPRLELANMVVSSEKSADQGKTVATFDNRSVTAGLTLSHSLIGATQDLGTLYGNASVGRAVSKVTLDETAPRTFKQTLLSDIAGNLWSVEFGSWIPLRPDFGLNLAMVRTAYQADLSQARGTFEGEVLAPDDSLSLVSGSRNGADTDLWSSVTITAYTAKLGLVFQF